MNFKAKYLRQRDGSQHDETSTTLGEISPQQRYAIVEASRLGREKRWEEALALFAESPDRTPALHGAVMDACAKSLQLGAARRLFDEEPRKTRPAYNILIFLLGRLKKTREAEALVKEMREACLSPNAATYGSLVSAYGNVGDGDAVLRTFEEMEAAGVKANTVTFATALAACAKVGDVAASEAMLARMDAANIEPNVGHFTSAIKACGRRRDEERGRAQFEELRRRGLEPDVVAWTCLMSCLSGPDVLAKAEALLAEMRAAGVAPNDTTHGTLLRAAIESKAPKRAREILAEIEALGVARTPLLERRLEQVEDLEHVLAEEQRSKEALPSAAPPSRAAEPPPLPAGWLQALDPASGRPYYWASADPAGTTTWSRPAA